MIIFGKHPVLEALEAGKSFDKIMVDREQKGEFVQKLRELAVRADIPVQYVPAAKLDRLTKGTHQGVVAFLSMVSFYKTEDVVAQVIEKGEMPLLLVLDEVTDVRNFGAMARTALNTGVHAMIIPDKGAAPVNAEAMKASAGALNKIYVCREKNLVQTVKQLKLNGIQVLATDARAQEYIYRIDLNIPTAIIMGGEGQGIHPQLLREADTLVKIPMVGKLDSYNVSVAAGMILYEALRQKMAN